jgi:hypothetical protein
MMRIKSGSAATIELYLPEIEDAATEMGVNPAYLLTAILSRVDWRSTLDSIRAAKIAEDRADLGPLFEEA